MGRIARRMEWIVVELVRGWKSSHLRWEGTLRSITETPNERMSLS